MSLPDVQLFLEQAFEFLLDRQFNLDQGSWQKFCVEKQINVNQLETTKRELSNQLKQATGHEKIELLQQIFCCDPFDPEVIKKLRDIWAEQPAPYKNWSYDLADHLVTISNFTTSEIPPVEIKKIDKINHQEEQNNNLPSKTHFELVKITLAASIIGICIIIALLLVNNRQTTNQSNNSTTSASPNQDNTIQNSTINQPDPADFIRNHYQLLANRDYQTTWQNLSSNFTHNLSYSDYQKWWDSVARIQLSDITTITQNNNSAKVKADLFYTTNTGRTVEDKKKFIYLQWEPNRSNWLIEQKSSF